MDEAATTAELEQRLDRGDWLKPGEVGVLFGKSRWTVINWITNGYRVGDGDERIYIGYRTSGGGHRELDPADVKRALAAYRRRRTAAPGD